MVDFNTGTPTVVGCSSFNPDKDAQVLRTAVKGLGTDEKSIIALVSRRSLHQRLIIRKRYEYLFGRNLKADLKSDTFRHFKQLLGALFTDAVKYDRKWLKRAMPVLGTRILGLKEDILVEIIVTRTNSQRKAILNEYQSRYNISLEDDIRCDVNNKFQKFICDFCKAERDESEMVDTEAALNDAKQLYATSAKWGSSEDCLLLKLLISKSFFYLKAVFEDYKNISNMSMEQAVENQLFMDHDLQLALSKIVLYVLNPHAYFANELHNSMRGLGTRDGDLIRLIVTRCEKDMVEIKKAYQLLNQMDLKTAIHKDTRGNYRALLLALVS